MSRMSFLEWVGLFIILIVLFDFYQNGGYGWFGNGNKQDKQSVSKKTSP